MHKRKNIHFKEKIDSRIIKRRFKSIKSVSILHIHPLLHLLLWTAYYPLHYSNSYGSFPLAFRCTVVVSKNLHQLNLSISEVQCVSQRAVGRFLMSNVHARTGNTFFLKKQFDCTWLIIIVPPKPLGAAEVSGFLSSSASYRYCTCWLVTCCLVLFGCFCSSMESLCCLVAKTKALSDALQTPSGDYITFQAKKKRNIYIFVIIQ